MTLCQNLINNHKEVLLQQMGAPILNGMNKLRSDVFMCFLHAKKSDQVFLTAQAVDFYLLIISMLPLAAAYHCIKLWCHVPGTAYFAEKKQYQRMDRDCMYYV